MSSEVFGRFADVDIYRVTRWETTGTGVSGIKTGHPRLGAYVQLWTPWSWAERSVPSLWGKPTCGRAPRPQSARCAGEAALLHLALRPGNTDLSARPELARELQR